MNTHTYRACPACGIQNDEAATYCYNCNTDMLARSIFATYPDGGEFQFTRHIENPDLWLLHITSQPPKRHRWLYGDVDTDYVRNALSSASTIQQYD